MVSFTQYRLSPQYRVVFGTGYWALAFPRVGGSRYYGYCKTLANHCLSHISSDFHLDPEFGWLGPSALAQSSLGGLLGCWAALGPTDLVAFASLSERFSFPKRVSNILKGEGLLNDASGLVAFQVALTAWTTGAFSLGQASSSLIFSILGGFLMAF